MKVLFCLSSGLASRAALSTVPALVLKGLNFHDQLRILLATNTSDDAESRGNHRRYG